MAVPRFGLNRFDSRSVEAFAADVTLRVRAPAPRIDALRAALADATRGRAVVSE